MTITDFEQWFEIPMQRLNSDPDAAFAVLMIAIPLLERYLREKSGVYESGLSDRFYTEFRTIFPTLTQSRAREFWHCYRNGLLHQSTFSRMTTNGTVVPRGWISSRQPETPEIINYYAAENCFILLPKEFSDEVVRIIRSDFATFLGAGSPNHPPPSVSNPGSPSTSATSPLNSWNGPPGSG